MFPDAKYAKSFEITLTAERCEALGIDTRDILEVHVTSDKKVPSPVHLPKLHSKRVLKDKKRGPVYGPFNDLNDFLASLHVRPNKIQLSQLRGNYYGTATRRIRSAKHKSA
jgi:bifunctional DNA-binding transcriptional regulator/antitoxin component of YhaV-PrlF toxin-antitoxin module